MDGSPHGSHGSLPGAAALSRTSTRSGRFLLGLLRAKEAQLTNEAADLIEAQAAEIERLVAASAEKDGTIQQLRAEVEALRGDGGGAGAAAAPQAEPRAQPQMPAGYTAGALLEATMDGDAEGTIKCLEAGIAPDAWHERLADWTPLFYAAQRGHLRIMEALLDHGADPTLTDRQGETPLNHAGYWGQAEAAELLLARGGGEPSDVRSSVIVPPEKESTVGTWHAGRSEYTTLLCSAPEFSQQGDEVMVGLFAMCKVFTNLKFGYDWGGSTTAEPADANPKRIVPDCCHSLSCTCADRSSVMIVGPVDWSNPKSVAGSMWFPKYRTKVMGAIQAEAQRGVKYIEMLAIAGGPVSQLERRTMPTIICGAVKDLKMKGVRIILVGEEEDPEAIKVFLRTMEFDEFFGRFYRDLPLSSAAMCLLVGQKIRQEQLYGMDEAQLQKVGLAPEDIAVALAELRFSVVGPKIQLNKEGTAVSINNLDRKMSVGKRGPPTLKNSDRTAGRTAEKKNQMFFGDWNAAVGNMAMRSGRHYAEVSIQHAIEEHGDARDDRVRVGFGVACASFDASQGVAALSSECCYVLLANRGWLMYGGGRDSAWPNEHRRDWKRKCKDGSTLGLLLDMDEGFLAVYTDAKTAGLSSSTAEMVRCGMMVPQKLLTYDTVGPLRGVVDV
eukprot:COSAG04_NODE_3413_length_2834_cov_2.395978_1_plen_667_part_10